jgi:hypothetical protein
MSVGSDLGKPITLKQVAIVAILTLIPTAFVVHHVHSTNRAWEQAQADVQKSKVGMSLSEVRSILDPKIYSYNNQGSNVIILSPSSLGYDYYQVNIANDKVVEILQLQ